MHNITHKETPVAFKKTSKKQNANSSDNILTDGLIKVLRFIGVDSPSVAKSNSPAVTWEDWLASESEVFFLYARQQTRTEADAKDILQGTLAETWKKNKGAIPDKALVFATIRRRSIDLGRSQTRRTKREDRYFDDVVTWFTIDYSKAETQEILVRAINNLPEKLREVLTLKLWGELTFPEISRLTNTTVSTVTSRYRYAIEHLQKNEQLAELKP